MRRSERTKARILAAAESLFARQGIEGTSLREISSRAGLSNTSSVQYHFGDKANLLESLFLDRMLQMEPRRKAMLARAKKDGMLQEIGTLIGVICLPLVDVVDSTGKHTYAEFLAQYLLRYRPPLGAIAEPPELPAPLALNQAQSLLRKRLSHLPDDVIARRLIVSVLGFLVVLTNSEAFGSARQSFGDLDIALMDTIDQIAVAIALPLRETGASGP